MTPVVVGRYELHGKLASGGMATVYLGRSVGSAGFSRSVAIKRLHESFACDPDFVSMLLEEGRLSERIRHANVVTVLDVVAAERELLLVMEYVQGETLARLLRACAEARVRCPQEIAVAIAYGVLLGLHASHHTTDASGNPLCIIHRDVSPQNIIVGIDGVARLLDFGIAKAAGSASATREGKVKGKVPYMAPEVLELQPASVASDIYAVAVTLWESLCGRRLFRSDTEVGLWSQVLVGDIPRPSSVVGPLGPLEDVVMRGLARSADDRHPSALAMAEALAAAVPLASTADIAAWVRERAASDLAERAAALRAMDRLEPRASAELTPSAAMSAPTTPERRSWRWLVALLAFAALAMAAVVAFRRIAARRAHDVESHAPPVASAIVVPAPVTAASASTEATASAAPLPPPAVSAAATTLPARRRAVSAPPSAAPRASQDPCDPPYSVDATGRKHFKMNCVN